MRGNLVWCGQVAALLAACSCFAGAARKAGDRGYTGGEAGSVSGWGAKDFQEIKKLEQPLCVYVFDPKYGSNITAKFLEGILGSAEVKEKLKPFLCVKLKSDGSDSKGWPSDWMARSYNGAVLVVASSDFGQKLVYDKDNKETVSAVGLAVQLRNIAKYEEERKAFVAKGGTKLSAGAPGAAPVAAPVTKETTAKPLPAAEAEKKPENKPEKKKTIDGPTEE